MSEAALGAKAEARASTPAAAARQAHRAPHRRPHRPLVWLLFGLLVVTMAVPLVTTVVMGPASYETIARSYPGPTTAILTTLARTVADISSLLTAGALVSALFLGRGSWAKVPGGRALETGEWFETVVLRRAAACWLLSAMSLVVLEAADSNGLPLSRMADPQALRFALFSGDYPRAWMLSTVAAAVCVAVSMFALRWVSYLIALWACVLGALAPVVVGHVLVGPDHDFGGDAAVYQTVFLQVAFGTLVVLAMRLASGRRIPRPGRARWFGLIVGGLVAVALSEMVIVWFKLAGSQPWESATGWFSIVRLGGLAVVAIGLWFGRPSRGASAGPHRGWLGVATAGAAVVVTAGTAMTRIPPPQFFVETSISQIFLGFDLPQAPSFAELMTGWRPNLLFGIAAVAGIACYLAAVWRLRGRGIAWPLGRTIPWIGGWLIVLVTTSSGFGKYSGADFAVHMGVHMTLNMVAPIFLVLGGPITLALRAFRPAEAEDAPGPREWISTVMASRALNLLYHPLLVFGLYIGSYYALYFSGAFGTLMRFHWAHQLMNLHFLIVGCLYFGLVVGVDQVPRKLPHIGKLGFIMAAMPFHAFFGVILMSSDTLIGENFYRHLDQPWATDLGHTQYIAGGVAWAGGEIPLLIVVVVLAIQWAIQDGKDARRIDRRLDTHADNEHAAYNEMLQRLQSHDAHLPQPNTSKDSTRKDSTRKDSTSKDPR